MAVVITEVSVIITVGVVITEVAVIITVAAVIIMAAVAIITVVMGMDIMVVGTTVIGTPEMAATGTVAGTLMALAPVGVSHPLVGFGFAVTEQWSKKGGGVRHPLRSYLGLGADDAESVRRWRPPH